MCQASVPSLGLLLCAANGVVRILDEESGTFSLLHTLQSYFSIKSLVEPFQPPVEYPCVELSEPDDNLTALTKSPTSAPFAEAAF